MILRLLAVLVGLALLAATAHVTVLATGGYNDPHAVLVIAITAGVGVGALCIGQAFAQRRFTVAFLIAVALLSGEAFGLLQTGERIISAREEAQLPAQQARTDRADAAKAVTAAKLALDKLTTSHRLDAALEAKATADRAVVSQAALRGCRRNCRALLQQQVDTASAEIKSARAALQTKVANSTVRLRNAESALAAIKVPRSGAGLADRLGLPAWGLDLIAAALGSIAANGLGCCLLAFGAHGARSRKPLAADAFADKMSKRPEITNPHEHVARFGVECLQPSDGTLPLLTLQAAYSHWCSSSNIQPLPEETLASSLGDLFRQAGLDVKIVQGQPYVLGVKLNDNLPKLIEAA